MNTRDMPKLALEEALERLEAMAHYVRSTVERATPAALSFKPPEAEFSLREQACHLRDLEREGYLVRARRMLSEETPALEGFDGAAVAAARDYPAQDAVAAARDFEAARRETLAILRSLTPRSLAREATFAGKRICMLDLMAMMAEHDRGHREEMERLAEAAGSA